MPIDDFILESKDLANVQSIWRIMYEFLKFYNIYYNEKTYLSDSVEVISFYSIALVSLGPIFVTRTKRINWFSDK